MILTIGVCIVVTIAIAAFVLAPRLFEPRLVFDATPDPPAAFGYRMAWVAIRTIGAARVAEVLGLEAVEESNWSTGIGTIYDERLSQGRVYLTPPINGWIFVVGLSLPQPLGNGFIDKCSPMLQDLAGAFPEAQYYLCYAPMDFYAWARVADGKLLRAFAIGDEGVIWNKGKPTREEREIGLKFAEVRGVKGRKTDVGAPMPIVPTEAHVLHLASSWSLDPTTLQGGKPDPHAGLGYICLTPAAWRPERLRRAG